MAIRSIAPMNPVAEGPKIIGNTCNYYARQLPTGARYSQITCLGRIPNNQRYRRETGMRAASAKPISLGHQ